jgi:DNA-binding NarL/FixJ family response regulator
VRVGRLKITNLRDCCQFRILSLDGELDTLVPAFATTIHKSQGSEYPAVVIPLTTQHYTMLARNLVYTGVTRGKQLVVIIGLTDTYLLLTDREKEVLQLLAEGRSNKEVATLLDLGLSTVETHRANLMQKLNLHNTAEIVLYAVRKGIIV